MKSLLPWGWIPSCMENDLLIHPRNRENIQSTVTSIRVLQLTVTALSQIWNTVHVLCCVMTLQLLLQILVERI